MLAIGKLHANLKRGCEFEAHAIIDQRRNIIAVFPYLKTSRRVSVHVLMLWSFVHINCR